MKKLLVLSILALAACQPKPTSSDAGKEITAVNADTETCSACGMVVREQPSPRGQVVHRDGSREFFCSIDDLVQYLDVPSPRGKPVKVFTEIMSDDHDIEDLSVAWRPWGEAADIFFVTGIDRGGVMGAPAMTYRTQTAAEKAAKELGGMVVGLEQLRDASRK